ncbi:hypothetical protein BK796_09235 [Kosakonia pseudosacchari]|uniref:Uncharacterized protein n=1 Tax=Kosakonia pseudosacchari TaxID=1646340 RepID=A0ABX4IRN2_9ENTR|nr:hypothetical protein BK796_09235 [Kosakonia pseudosacchari]
MSTPAGRKNRRNLPEQGAKTLPFLIHVNQKQLTFTRICLFYVKSISVKSHIIVVKKVELDRRNGYIYPETGPVAYP